jgi:hypothetical protein
MSALDSILPALNAEAPSGGDGTAAQSAPPEKAGESFDHMMSRAISSAPTGTKKADAGPAGKLLCHFQPQHTIPDDSKLVAPHSGVKDSEDGGKKTGDTPKHSQTTSETKVVSGDIVSPENLQDPLASLLTPTPVQLTASAMTAAPALITVQALPAATPKAEASGNTTPPISIPQVQAGKLPAVSTGIFSKPTITRIVDGSKPKETQAVEKAATVVVPNSSHVSSAKPAAVSTEKMLQPLQAVAVEKEDSTGAKPAQAPQAVSEEAAAPKIFVAPDLLAKPSAPPVSAEHGTAVAKQDVPMKNGQQMNEVAGSGEKVLPGGAVLAAPEKNLPVRDAVAAPVPARIERADAIYTSAPAAAVSESGSRGDAAPVSTAVETRPQVVERTHEMVAAQAVRLQEAGSDVLRVVIKPDAGTQLSLELRQHGDGVEAQVTLQHGDFSQLNQHWGDLQQRLELRGVKLSPLADGQSFANFGNSQNSFQHRPDQAAEEDSLAGAFGGFSPAGRIAETPALPASSRGWEGWA